MYAARVISIAVIGILLCLGVRPAVHARRAPLRMLALGDSYTIGESVAVVDRYPVQLVTRLRDSDHILLDRPEIIATTGWTTGNLLDALSVLQRAGPYAVVTLLIGVNNSTRGAVLPNTGRS